MIDLPPGRALKDMVLDDIWSFYSEPSAYGREVYALGGVRGPSLCYFAPYLSAMQLFTPASPKDGQGESWCVDKKTVLAAQAWQGAYTRGGSLSTDLWVRSYRDVK